MKPAIQAADETNSDRMAHLGYMRAKGAVFGVWNANLPDEPLVLRESRLKGGKAFASGAGLLSHLLSP